ncbi:MAG: hypothetical protein Tsb0014_14510 [Pleurocapsa sp.]
MVVFTAIAVFKTQLFPSLTQQKSPQVVAKTPDFPDLSATTVLARLPSAANISTIPLQQHPRLLASSDRFAEIKEQIETDPMMAKWYQALIWQADSYIKNSELPKYEIPDGKRLLTVSQRMVKRISTLALVYRISGEPKYLEQAWQQLEAAATFPDWNPSHFLDTAEMTHAFAIGYDWLYADWSESQRDLLASAIATKSLQPALTDYHNSARWTQRENNWNLVCNGGVGMGALAILDRQPQLASQVLAEALKRLPLAMENYAPDGAWDEGTTYWDYTTLYNTAIVAALDTALGTDFNLANIAGFAETGLFPIYLTNPWGLPFNFADSKAREIPAPQLFWLADRFQQSAYRQYQQRHAMPEALDLIWYDSENNNLKSPPLPLDKYFQGAEIITMRSQWDNPEAIFVGFKAGDNQAEHGNLDLGTFAIDALGQQWGIELGQDNYNLPGYFDKKDQRWTYYRIRAEGQNTLVINPDRDPDQNPEAKTKIIQFNSTPQAAYAIADLTPAYSSDVRSVKRGVALRGIQAPEFDSGDSPSQDGRQQILVQDEIEAYKPVDVWWFMHTKADIELQDKGKTALLRQKDKQLQVKLLNAGNYKFTIEDALPLSTSPKAEGQDKNTGIKKLAIQLNGITSEKIAVLFIPLNSDQSSSDKLPKIISLADWETGSE